jgi:hypothetical protein
MQKKPCKKNIYFELKSQMKVKVEIFPASPPSSDRNLFPFGKLGRILFGSLTFSWKEIRAALLFFASCPKIPAFIADSTNILRGRENPSDHENLDS